MSDTPTFANRLTRWNSGDPSARQRVYAHLHKRPTEAAAVEAFLRDELRSAIPGERVTEAEAMVEVYRGGGSVAGALAWVVRQGNSAAVTNSIAVLQKLSPSRAGSLIETFVLWAPAEFRELTPGEHRWTGATAARAEGAADIWFAFLGHAGPRAEPALLQDLAEAAASARADLSPLTPGLTARLFHEGSGYAAGAALWRITWRVHRDWLASINPHGPRFEGDPGLLALVADVLIEHLGRRPGLAPVVRDLSVRLSAAAPRFTALVQRLLKCERGWPVLPRILGDKTASAWARVAVFEWSAKHPNVRALAHRSAHNVILDPITDPSTAPSSWSGRPGRCSLRSARRPAPRSPTCSR
ncbi:MAG TPA: hypothetical protein VGE74_22255 [Gemmata sp.]